MASDSCETVPTKAARAVRFHVPTLLLGLLLAGWLVVQLPAFLCMGLWVDPSMYDVVARRVLKGDVHYRDLMETNLPGIVWLHMGVRALFGWSSVALRAFDVAVVGATVFFLTKWLPRPAPARWRIGMATAIFAFYFSTTEWCHCQRDVWMLPLCLGGLALRGRQAGRLLRSDPASRILLWAAVEGIVWGAAVWIKPFAAIPGLVCWVASVWHATSTHGAFRRLAADLSGLLAGGMAIGAMGVSWLVATGAWGSFLDVMLVWNREYFASNMCSDTPLRSVLNMAYRFCPWILVHFVAVPLALKSLFARRGEGSESTLRAGFYLAWLLQAFLLQHLFDYVHVPAVFLGIAILTVEGAKRRNSAEGWLIVGFLILCFAWRGVSLTAERAAVWSECVSRWNTPDLRYRVGAHHRFPWEDLARTADYLRSQNVRDGEVTCFTGTTVSLYNDLDIRPSMRYLFPDVHLLVFLKRREEILQSLVDGRQKYLVCDLGTESNPRSELSERVAFRSGQIVVFRLDGSEVPKWLGMQKP